jgi:hypothetical protein
MLLAAASSVERLQPILAGLGFESSSEPADVATRAALRIPADYREVSIAHGPGALRALIVTAPRSLAIREATTRVAGRLAASAPHILWLLVVTDPECEQLAFATWTIERKPPSIAALIVDRARVVDSDGETLAALAAARSELDVLTHGRWLDILGRESVTRRFYRTLERVVHVLADSESRRGTGEERTELALLCVSRLLFLSFLEAKGWLDGDRGFLARTFDDCLSSGGGYHRRVLLPLLHGTLNTRYSARAPAARAFGHVPFLNGGLFARTPLERRHRGLVFCDEHLGVLFGDLLSRYRFTAREDSAAWSEAAIDPEMLGKAFESIMASRERRSTGAYFTPQSLVARVTSGALRRTLADIGLSNETCAALVDGRAPDSRPAGDLRDRLARIRIIDPACGSGAFLVHALERIATMLVVLGDARDLAEIRREVLIRSIFGVDRNPFAVWLCELRLWLSMVIESHRVDPLMVPPLPNLDHHIRVGDALSGDALAPLPRSTARHASLAPARRSAAAITMLRGRYVRASGPRKQSLARALDRAERARATAIIDDALELNAARRRDLLAAVRSRDLFGERHRVIAADAAALAALKTGARELRSARRIAAEGTLPFSFATHFADSAAAGGFDVVIGNPPWVRIHRIPATTRARLRSQFAVFQDPGWARGTELAHAGSGFSAQVDLAALFVERSLELLRDGGVFSLLLPSKLWRSLAGGSLRRLLRTHATLLELDDLGESPESFDAAVYPSIVVGTRGRIASATSTPEAHAPTTAKLCPAPPTAIATTLVRRSASFRWSIDHERISLDDDIASPWVLVPAEVRDAFDRLAAAGDTLAASVFGRPHLGVKCGCNAAFIVCEHDRPNADPAVTEIEAPGRRGRIERTMVRPLVRGETLRPWISADGSAERIVWPHDSDGTALGVLPPLARHWLLPWRRRLLMRSDGHGRGQWWSLFRTESARVDRPRVVWADIGRSPRAAVLPAGDPTVPLNSCYVVRCRCLDDAHALAALLNGPLVAAWLSVVAEPARGGFHRYLGWTMALLPTPRDWQAARDILAPLGARASGGDVVSSRELLGAALRAYRVDLPDVAPLLAWASR